MPSLGLAVGAGWGASHNALLLYILKFSTMNMILLIYRVDKT